MEPMQLQNSGEELFQDHRKKKLLKLLSILLFGITLFYAAVCTPVWVWAVSDILIADTVFPLVLDIIMTICNYLFYWCAFAILLFAFFRYGLRESLSFYLIYGGAVFFRYIANQLASCFVVGFPRLSEFVSYSLQYLLFDIVLDLILLGVAVGLMILLTRQSLPSTVSKKNRELFFEKQMPFVKLTDMKNTILRTTLCIAAIPAAVQLISRLIYDFSLGAPASVLDLLWMIVYYISDIASFLIGYFVIVLLFNQLYLREEKAKLKFEASYVLDEN